MFEGRRLTDNMHKIKNIYFILLAMVRHLEQLKKERLKNGLTAKIGSSQPYKNMDGSRNHSQDMYECVALHISPDLGERIMLSGDRSLLDEVFPETNQAVMDARTGAAWNQQDAHQVIR